MAKTISKQFSKPIKKQFTKIHHAQLELNQLESSHFILNQSH